MYSTIVLYSTEISSLYGKFTWRIPNFGADPVGKRELRSSIFRVGPYRWYILVYPHGCDVSNHLSLFLCVADYDKLLPGWGHFAQFTMTVVNAADPKKSKYSDTLHRFCKKEHDWGWKKFMELNKIGEGFVAKERGGEVVICAQVQVIAADRPARPLRTLDAQYRRELMRVYSINVDSILRRCIDEKKAVLKRLVGSTPGTGSNDTMDRFVAFWEEQSEDRKVQLASTPVQAVFKSLMKKLFNEKEVTSTLVTDALYCGAKLLETAGRVFFEADRTMDCILTSGGGGSEGGARGTTMPVPPSALLPHALVIDAETDQFVFVNDLVASLHRIASEEIPPFTSDKTMDAVALRQGALVPVLPNPASTTGTGTAPAPTTPTPTPTATTPTTTPPPTTTTTMTKDGHQHDDDVVGDAEGPKPSDPIAATSAATTTTPATASGETHSHQHMLSSIVDSMYKEECRLVDLGRRTVEVFAAAHIVETQLEVAWEEVETLKRQDALIREEEEASRGEAERAAARAEAEREKRARKKEKQKAKKEAEKAKKMAEEEELRRLEEERKAQAERHRREAEEKRRREEEEKEVERAKKMQAEAAAKAERTKKKTAASKALHVHVVQQHQQEEPTVPVSAPVPQQQENEQEEKEEMQAMPVPVPSTLTSSSFATDQSNQAAAAAAVIDTLKNEIVRLHHLLAARDEEVVALKARLSALESGSATATPAGTGNGSGSDMGTARPPSAPAVLVAAAGGASQTTAKTSPSDAILARAAAVAALSSDRPSMQLRHPSAPPTNTNANTNRSGYGHPAPPSSPGGLAHSHPHSHSHTHTHHHHGSGGGGVNGVGTTNHHSGGGGGGGGSNGNTAAAGAVGTTTSTSSTSSTSSSSSHPRQVMLPNGNMNAAAAHMFQQQQQQQQQQPPPTLVSHSTAFASPLSKRPMDPTATTSTAMESPGLDDFAHMGLITDLLE